MPWWAWMLVGIAVLGLIALVGWSTYRRRRSDRLRQAFGPEYDRVVSTTGDQRGAESELESRQKRRARLDIRPLSVAARGRYAEAWRDAQGRFVDSPSDAVGEAETEDLRQAMVHYRTLFEVLLGIPEGERPPDRTEERPDERLRETGT